jgi:hypothetical protein
LKKNLFLLKFLLLAGINHCLAQETLRIETGTNLRTANNTFIVLDNTNLVNNGSFQQVAGNGTLKFSGTTNLNLSGSGTTTLDQLNLSLTGSNQVNLQKNIGVLTALSFSSGLLNLGNNIIDLGTTGTLTGESETSRAFTTGNGYIQVTTTLAAPSSANPANLGVVISSSANLGSTIIRRGHRSQVNSTGNGTTILRYYDIVPTLNSGLNATLRFQYFDAELNGLTESMLSLWRSFNNVNWTDLGFSSRNATSNFVEQTGISSFARFTLTTTNNTLPLHFTSLHTACNNGKTTLTWTTADEEPGHFEIEKTIDMTRWTVIGSIPTTGQGINTYSFTDASAADNALYRIVAHHINGSKVYSRWVRSSCSDPSSLSVYPNPVRNSVTVSLFSAAPTSVRLSLYDAKGALLLVNFRAVAAGINLLQLPMEAFAKGTYLLSVTRNNETENIRLIKGE